MSRRQAIAAIAFAGIFISLYLTLYKLGVIGNLSCSVGSCETVNTSRWAMLLGLPVAVWGLGFYVATFALALAGLQERWSAHRGVSLGLVTLTGWGVIFSAYLTWLELFVIHAICMWCVVSAVLVVVMFALSLLDWRRERESTPEGGLRSAARQA
jgi:uncharacterized membrane protein